MYKVAGVTKAVYIPVDVLDEVITLNKEYKRLKRIIVEIIRSSKEIIRRYVKEKRLKGAKKMSGYVFFIKPSDIFLQSLQDELPR